MMPCLWPAKFPRLTFSAIHAGSGISPSLRPGSAFPITGCSRCSFFTWSSISCSPGASSTSRRSTASAGFMAVSTVRRSLPPSSVPTPPPSISHQSLAASSPTASSAGAAPFCSARSRWRPVIFSWRLRAHFSSRSFVWSSVAACSRATSPARSVHFISPTISAVPTPSRFSTSASMRASSPRRSLSARSAKSMAGITVSPRPASACSSPPASTSLAKNICAPEKTRPRCHRGRAARETHRARLARRRCARPPHPGARRRDRA